MTREDIPAAEKLIQQLKAEGWQEQRSGICYANGMIGTNLLKYGQVITVQQEFYLDEGFLEQEWGEDV